MGNIEDGQYHEVILDWDPTTNIFTYYFDGMLKETLTRDFINLDFNGDSNVYYGFTGATGGAKNLQKVCILEQTITFSEYDYGDAPDGAAVQRLPTITLVTMIMVQRTYVMILMKITKLILR